MDGNIQKEVVINSSTPTLMSSEKSMESTNIINKVPRPASILPLILMFILFAIIVIILCVLYGFGVWPFSKPYYARDPMTGKPTVSWKETVIPIFDYSPYEISFPVEEIRYTYLDFHNAYCDKGENHKDILCTRLGTHSADEFKERENIYTV